MPATHLATYANVETRLRSSLLAADAPGAAPSEVLMKEIESDSAKYQEILDSSRKVWTSNVDRLKAIFNWGFNLGELIRLNDNNPKEGARIIAQITELRDKLQKYYKGKKNSLKDGQIKQEFEMIPQESDAIIDSLFQLHIRIDLVTTKDFGSVYDKYNARTDIDKIANAFPTAELKKEQVTATATFFVYHLAIFVMFRNGLIQGVAGKKETKDTVMIAELAPLVSSIGKAFQDIEKIITN